MLDSVCEDSEFEFFGYYETPEISSAGNTPMNSDAEEAENEVPEDAMPIKDESDESEPEIDSNKSDDQESEADMSYNCDSDYTYISDYEQY